jgi:hypothetical protein
MRFFSRELENLNPSASRSNRLARQRSPASEAHILTPNHPKYFPGQFQTQVMLPMGTTGSNALGLTPASWINKKV